MSQDRYRARRSRLLAAVKPAEIDAVLISHPPNVRYLTGFTGEDSELLFGPKHCRPGVPRSGDGHPDVEDPAAGFRRPDGGGAKAEAGGIRGGVRERGVA
jgi:hypothetical protein